MKLKLLIIFSIFLNISSIKPETVLDVLDRMKQHRSFEDLIYSENIKYEDIVQFGISKDDQYQIRIKTKKDEIYYIYTRMRGNSRICYAIRKDLKYKSLC